MTQTIRSPFDLGIPLVPDDVPDNLIPVFQSIFNAFRVLQQAVGDFTGANFTDLQYLIDNALVTGQTIQVQNLQILRIPTSLAINKGQIVNLFDSGAGVVQTRLAIATGMATKAFGIALNTTLAAGDTQLVGLFSGYYAGYAGFVTMSTYYLSDVTPGAFTLIAPVAAGTIMQELGAALSGAEFLLSIKRAVQN